MIKKYILLFLFIVCLPLSLTVETGLCEEEVVTWNKDNSLSSADLDYFLRPFFEEHYKVSQGYVNEFLDETTFHQNFVYDAKATDSASIDIHAKNFSVSDLIMTMLPAKQTYQTTNKYLNFVQYRQEEFHAALLVRETENLPEETGGKCWIRYSDIFVAGAGKESGVIFYPGDKAYRYAAADGNVSYTEIADLSAVSVKEWTQFDFIRSGGIIYVYANGEYLFDYQDEIQGGVTFEMGSELREDGNRIRCDFDDFVMRIH